MERNEIGRTPGFAEVKLDRSGASAGDLVSVRVTQSDGVRLQGERLVPKCAP